MGSLFQRIGDYIKRTDIWIWLLCISSTVISSILLSSVERAGGKFVTTQIMAAVIGIVAAIVISVIDYEYISRYWAALAGISMILFLSVFLFGITVEGTDDTAWLRLPGGLTFQPSELVKIFFIVTFSTHLHHLNKTDKLKTFPGVLGLLGHTLIPVAIIHFQGDDGSALIFMFMALIMMFVAGVQARYFITLITGLAIGIPVVWNFIMNNEHRNRILALADIDGNAKTDYGWQQFQSKVSIASGELFGYGPTKGYRTGEGLVPEQENDFIFSVAGEEFGFIGCVVILLILLFLIFRAFMNAISAKDDLGKYICYGMFALLASQTIINIGMVLGLLPVIGITLPFYSAGGTSSMCIYFGIGLIQSVRLHNKDVDNIKISYTRHERIKI